jgi:hypothetical protein
MRKINKETWTRVRVAKDNIDKGITWSRETLGPKYRYLHPTFAGWAWERQGNIVHFFFEREGDALMFKLAIESLEETVE